MRSTSPVVSTSFAGRSELTKSETVGSSQIMETRISTEWSAARPTQLRPPPAIASTLGPATLTSSTPMTGVAGPDVPVIGSPPAPGIG